MNANRFLLQALWAVGLVFISVGYGVAAPISLDLPVRCELGKACFVQNYVDHDPGFGYRDFACGYLTYNDHAGTDFRVIDEVAMVRGVPVVAAAPGIVLGVRDGEPDVAVSVRGTANLNGKDAGNGVVIDHGDGWQTQYSHLRKGSVVVQKGQTVSRGDVLGMIGESGNADFPHVDFSVRQKGKVVDPYQPEPGTTCSTSMSSKALWSSKAQTMLSYIPTALLQVGFADHVPNRLEAQSGKLSVWVLSRESPALVLWIQVMGAQEGDSVDFEIQGPDGGSFVSKVQTIRGNKAVWIGGIGKRRVSQGWRTGWYTGKVRLIRQGKVLLEEQITLYLR